MRTLQVTGGGGGGGGLLSGLAGVWLAVVSYFDLFFFVCFFGYLLFVFLVIYCLFFLVIYCLFFWLFIVCFFFFLGGGGVMPYLFVLQGSGQSPRKI